MRLQSVAFPAFGTGVGRVAPKDAADSMVAAVRAHLTEVAGSSLRRVHFILFQDDIYRAFLTALGLGGARRVG
jgi:O-acetyl-ADP-ribose deacetylase (regulator of RNase III)